MAKAILLNVCGGEDLTMLEVNKAAEIIEQAADRDASIIFGFSTKENLDSELVITVIATGFEDAEEDEPVNAFGFGAPKAAPKKSEAAPAKEVDNDFPIPDFLAPRR